MDDDIKSFVIDKTYASQIDRALANLSLGGHQRFRRWSGSVLGPAA